MPAVPRLLVPAASGQVSVAAMFWFFAFFVLALYGSYWVANKSRTASEFYAGARRLNPVQNGLALAGDYMSAASLLGISGLCALQRFDALIYAVGFFVAWPLLLFLAGEPLKNLGRFSCADAVAYRLRSAPVRAASGVGTLFTVFFYLAAQMVGAGTVVSYLFGVSYETAVAVVGVFLMGYVLFGGVLATTWVQVIKAVLLLLGVTLLAGLALARFHFDPNQLCRAAVSRFGAGGFHPGAATPGPLETASLGVALLFGLLGLPHVLTRFFSLPDLRDARVSVVCATGFIGYFYCLIPLVGLGALALVGAGGGDVGELLGRNSLASLDPGGNLAAVLLADWLGGPLLLGFVAAVGFATILAVLGGLTLSGAFALSHDLFVNVVRGGHATEQEEVAVTRKAAVGLSLLAILLGLAFKGQNAAFLVGLAFAVACSANFPALFLSMFWRRFTTEGAVCAIWTGALLAVGMIAAGPTVWGEILGHQGPDGAPAGLVALRNPALVSMTASFVAGVVVSLATADPLAAQRYDEQRLRSQLGVGAD